MRRWHPARKRVTPTDQEFELGHHCQHRQTGGNDCGGCPQVPQDQNANDGRGHTPRLY